MTRPEFIDWLESIGAVYKANDENDATDAVYVFGKKELRLKEKFPKKYANLYVPYLRVSHFGDGESTLYTRDNGLCGWMFPERVKSICVALSK